jgi:thiol-disulfide isomerase/thioredoxin
MTLSRLKYASALVIAVTFALFCFYSNPAAAFVVKDSQGQTQSLDALKGKWVVVNFWATWCAPCVKEIPEIAEFAKAQGEKVRVIGIALDWYDDDKPTAAEEKKIKAAALKVGITYASVLGDDATEKIFGKQKGLPVTLIYNPAGKLVISKTGPISKQWLEDAVAGKAVK